MGSGADYGYGDGWTDASRAASENATNEMVGSINGAATAPTYNEDAAKAQYIGRSLPQRAVDWVRDIPNMAVEKIKDMVNNPVATLIDFAIPGAPGLINGLVGMATDKTIGKALVGGLANATSYNDQSLAGQTPSGPSAGTVAKSNDDSPDPNADDGRGSDGNGSTNPFGSSNSPLLKALLGNAQLGYPNWGGRKTYGAPVSSFSPYGRE